MKNVTITLDSHTLEAARRYAALRGLSLNAFLRELIQRTVRAESTGADSLFSAMDALADTCNVIDWKREELYRG